MIVFLNGAFGVGKTTVAHLLVKRLPKSMLFNPEFIGSALQRVVRVDDFQDLRAWRRLTIAALRVARVFRRNVIMPMAFSNVAYLDEMRDAARRIDPHVEHFTLVAPLATIQERLQRRGAEPWSFRRAEECCAVHGRPEFAGQIDADRPADAVAAELATILTRRSAPGE